jgi:hypothetical protein
VRPDLLYAERVKNHYNFKIKSIGSDGPTPLSPDIYKSKELSKESTCSILEQFAADGRNSRMNLQPGWNILGDKHSDSWPLCEDQSAYGNI